MKRILPLIIALNGYSASVTLQWDANPEPDIAGYTVYYGTASRTYPQSTNVGNVTLATVYGLTNGTTWFFAVTASNTNKLESDFSNEVTNTWIVTNLSPTIQPVQAVTMLEGQSTNLVVQVWDVETPPKGLVVTATSTNQSLLPDDRITVMGMTHERIVDFEPAAGQWGQTLVTLTVSDGTNTASTSFIVTVLDVPAPTVGVGVVTALQEALSPTGPWTNVVTTDYRGIEGLMKPGRFYRTWMAISSQ